MDRKKTIKKIIWTCVTSISLYFYFSGLSYLGSSYREAHRDAMHPKYKAGYNRGWKFHKGDDPAFAKTDLDDKNWETVACDSLPESYHGEVSWFRLHLKNDPSFQKKQLVFLLEHYGASELFLDGNKIAGFGTVGLSAETEKNYDPRNFPVNVDLQKCDSHVVAVRYSNNSYSDFQTLSEKNYTGFEFSIADFEVTSKNTEETQYAEIIGFCIATFLLTLAFIHFLLYLFYRSARENLFYSLFVFSFSAIFFSLLLMVNTPIPHTQLLFRNIFMIFLNPFLFLTLSLFVFSLGKNRLPRSFWVAVIFGLAGIIHVVTGWLSIGFYLFSVMWMAIYCVISMTIGTFIAFREKRTGYRILTAGVGTFALFIFVCISIVFYSNNLNFSFDSTGDIFFILLLMTLLSIPISMSIYLAYTSSRTNRDLKQKLSEVETLSAKSIEQEKEKQKILESQKETLEIQVKERTYEIMEQNKVIEEKNKDITDSLNYAKRIQEAILPSRELKKQLFPESFVLFKPKDIVSGDFYWYTRAESWNERHRTDGKGKRIIASVDCTGHGVPGAFMSMIGNNLLTEIVLEKGNTKPSEILDLLHEGVRSSLKQNKGGSETRDGMDIALVAFDPESNTIEYAGAQRPLWIIRASHPKLIEEVKADKFSIGGLESADRKKFTNHSIELKKEDKIYIFSDGFSDQFGGPDGKKFMSKRFKDLLLSIVHLPMNEQEEALENAIEKWKGRTVQIDDILVIGICI